MQNHFPLWKNILVLTVLVIGALYALPNLYGNDPAVQLASSNNTPLQQSQADAVTAAIKEAGYTLKSFEFNEGKILARFNNTD
jgi:preprotein translocase subunit SecD